MEGGEVNCQFSGGIKHGVIQEASDWSELPAELASRVTLAYLGTFNIFTTNREMLDILLIFTNSLFLFHSHRILSISKLVS